MQGQRDGKARHRNASARRSHAVGNVGQGAAMLRRREARSGWARYSNGNAASGSVSRGQGKGSVGCGSAPRWHRKVT